MIALKIHPVFFSFLMAQLTLIADTAMYVRGKIHDAIRRCNNCGSIMPPDTYICPRCGWDNIKQEEAK